jgi:hypothetical protein
MYALFVDFRAAFDKVDTEKIFELCVLCMYVRQNRDRDRREREREGGISERLVRNIEEIYARTKNNCRWERKKVNDVKR